MAGPSYSSTRKLGAAKTHEYSIVDKFKFGFRAREDVTTLPPGVLIEGSQNVLTNTFQRVGTRKGYELDGAANTDAAPIGGGGTGQGVFDWVTSDGEERNMRAGFLTGAGNDGKLQYRNASGVWTDLLTGLTSVNFNFCTYFDTDRLQTVMLAVNGTSNLYVWNGSATTVSVTGGANPTGIVGLIRNPGADTPGRISGGKNYVAGDVLTLSGGNNDAQITVLTVSTAGRVDTATVNAGGTGYAVNDQFEIGGAGNNTALCIVTGETLGVVTSFDVLNPGNGNIVATNVNTTATLGAGTGLKVNITNITGGGILTWAFGSDAYHGTGYTDNTKYTLTGGSGTLAYIWPYSTVSGSITKSGTDTWAQAGFTFGVSGTYTVLINNVTYTYDAADFLGDTLIMYGVTPDPSAITPGDAISSGVIVIPNGGGTNQLPSTFENQLIATMYGLIFLGSLEQGYVYISGGTAGSLYTAWPSAGRLVLGTAPTSFINQEDQIYISTGNNQWFVIERLTSSTLTHSFAINPISFASLQGAQSQALTTKDSNAITFVSFEPAVESFGPVQNIYQSPQVVNMSYSIVNLMNDYDFTGGSIVYYRKFIYIAAPRENTVLVYNMTDPKNPYWEAPQILPIGRFSIIGGELYGHSSQVSETYKLFTGNADRVTPTSTGFPISAVWNFSYENYGSRFSLKRATKYFVEGYISPGATLTANLTYELDGCKTVRTFELDGDNSQFVCIDAASGPLGKVPLGKVKLGGDSASSSATPPKFRWFPTFSPKSFFEVSPSFSALGIDAPVEILAFGLAVAPSSEIPVQNMD